MRRHKPSQVDDSLDGRPIISVCGILLQNRERNDVDDVLQCEVLYHVVYTMVYTWLSLCEEDLLKHRDYSDFTRLAEYILLWQQQSSSGVGGIHIRVSE